MKRLCTLLIFLFSISVVSATVVDNDCSDEICAFDLDLEADTFAEILTELESGDWRIILRGSNFITFIYRTQYSNITDVSMCCGLQNYLTNIQDDIWGRRYSIQNRDEAIIGFSFTELRDSLHIIQTEYEIWRGIDAPEAPPKSGELEGQVVTDTFVSELLTHPRNLTIYYPPSFDLDTTYPVLYSTDGGSIVGYAPYVDHLITIGVIEPILLVGVHSSNNRAEEYIPGLDNEIFQRHEAFFTEEVRLWAETYIGASTDTSQRAVHGFSNGAVFAATIALLHPDIYGIAFPFSAGMNPFTVYPDTTVDSDQRLYFTAGTLEPEFMNRTYNIANQFAVEGATIVWNPRIAGHDFFMWQEEMFYALEWAFGIAQ